MVREDLCDLARGIRPPLLAHKGPSPSLEAQARNVLQAQGVDRNACDRATTVRGSGLLNIAETAGSSRALDRGSGRLRKRDGAPRPRPEGGGGEGPVTGRTASRLSTAALGATAIVAIGPDDGGFERGVHVAPPGLDVG